MIGRRVVPLIGLALALSLVGSVALASPTAIPAKKKCQKKHKRAKKKCHRKHKNKRYVLAKGKRPCNRKHPCPPPPPPPPPGADCTRSATVATFAAQVSAAAPGEVICLADGNYGTFSGISKAITIRGDGSGALMRFAFAAGDSGFTIEGVDGAGGSVGGVSNVTVRGSDFNTCLSFSGSNTNVVFENNTHNNINATCGNARIRLEGSGMTVRNSQMVGGDSDGAFVGSSGWVFQGNYVAPCSSDGTTGNHTDGLQYADPGDPSGGWAGVVRGNFFERRSTCGDTNAQMLSSYDGGTNGALWEDNVVRTTRLWGIELYADQGSTVRHNTVWYCPNGSCAFSGSGGAIDVTHKSGDPASTGTQVYDNVAVVNAHDTTAMRNDHNVSGQFVTYIGPLSVYDGWHLAPGSVGKGAASDGFDVGIR